LRLKRRAPRFRANGIHNLPARVESVNGLQVCRCRCVSAGGDHQGCRMHDSLRGRSARRDPL